MISHLRTPRTAKTHAILNLILQFLFTWFYIQSLAGGNLEWIKKELDRLGTHLLLSVICFTLALGHLATRPKSLPHHLRLCLLFSLALILLCLFVYDNGDTPDHHGFYNFLVFALITVPLNGVIGLIYCCFALMHPRRAKLVIGGVFVGSILFLGASLGHYSRIWNHGALGERMKSQHGDQHLCTYGGSSGWNLPFVDLIPNGAMNVWAGPRTCSPIPGIHAEWSDETGELVVRCGVGVQASYDLLPDTRPFTTSEKMEGTFHRTVKDKTRRMEFPEGGLQPVIVDDPNVQAIVARCDPNLQKVLLRVGTPNHAVVDQVKNNTTLRPNILILFVDAVSRRQLFRKLPLTAQAIESLTSGAVGAPSLHQFFRYHSIGFSTDPNTRALYTGSSKIHQRPLQPIWGGFHSAGYMTARVDTNCEDWSVRYTEETSSEFWDRELLAPFCLPEYYPAEGNPFGNFKGPYSIVARCLGGRHVHTYALEWMSKLQDAYSAAGMPWFMIGSFIEGHEGSGEVLLTMDEDVAKFLTKLGANGRLEDTIVFIISDHGLHMGMSFLFTENGKLEHMNPLLMILLPSKLGSAFPSLKVGLNHTEQLLLTPYEVYNTLKLLSDGLEEFADTESVPLGVRWHGTLFDKGLPNRDCEQARISAKFCKCS